MSKIFMAGLATLLATGLGAQAVPVTWQGGDGNWDDMNWDNDGTANSSPTIADGEATHTIGDQYVLSSGTVTRNSRLTTVSPAGSWTQTGGALNISGGTERLRFANGAAESTFSGGAVVNVGELNFGRSTVTINDATFSADFINIPSPNADTVVNVQSGVFNLTNSNALQGNNFVNHRFDLLGPAGSFTMTQSNNTNASQGADLAGKVAGQFFSIDGTRVNPGIDNISDWSVQANIDLLNSELLARSVNGKALAVQLTGGGVSGSEQRLTIVNDPFEPLALAINGNFSDFTNQFSGPSGNTGAFNLSGSNGENIGNGDFIGSTIDVTGWAPFHEDPDSLIAALGAVGVDDAPTGPGGTTAELDGTFYLDNLWVDAASGNISLNSASNYRNGIVNENIFDGTAINANATYRVEGEFLRVSGSETSNGNSTVNFAITSGTGTDATDPANEIADIEIPLDEITAMGGVGDMQRFSFEVTGADLVAAGGQINLVVDLINTTAIPNLGAGVLPADISNTDILAQVRVDNIAIDISAPDVLPGDFNNDGFVNAADYTIWRDNLAGDESTLLAPGSGDGSGVVDAGDYTVWRSAFLAQNSGGALVDTVSTPEPTSLLLGGTLGLIPLSRRRRR